MVWLMKKQNYNLLLATALITLSQSPIVHAQTVKYQDSSVTIYDLGSSNAPTYNSPQTATGTNNISSARIIPDRTGYTSAAPQASIPSQPVITPNATPVTPSPAPAQTAQTEQKPPSPEAGWLGAIWSGRANLGASLQTGNTEQDAINADASAKAKWLDSNEDTKHRASIKAEINRETEDDEKTEDNRSLDLAYDYFFNEKWFMNNTLGFEQDDIEELDLRTTVGIGLGHQVYERDDLNLQYVLGPSYLREEFENGDSEDSLAARWAFDYDQKFWDEFLQAFHEHELLVPVDATDAFLIETKTGLRMPLKKGFLVTGEVDFDWDNDPAPGVQEDDTTYSVKIGYEW